MKPEDTLRIRFEDIDWDLGAEDGGSPPELPTSFDREYPASDFDECLTYDPATDDYLLDENAMEEPLGNKLSDEFGWCVNGFNWRLV